MRRALARAFACFGAEVTLVHGGRETAVRAFFQPIVSEAAGEPFSVGVLGAVDGRRWRYLGPAEAAMGDRLRRDGKTYVVRRAATVYLGGEPLYYRAVVQEESE